MLLSVNGYNGYPDFSVEGIYVEDTVYGSNYYKGTAIGQHAVSPNTLISSHDLTASYWTPIGGLGDKKYRSVERVSDCKLHGKQLENNEVRNAY